MKTKEEIEQLAEDFTTKDHGHYHYRGKDCFVRGYVDGYIQGQEDMADKKYTEEDVRETIRRTITYLATLAETGKFHNGNIIEEAIIQSLNKQD